MTKSETKALLESLSEAFFSTYNTEALTTIFLEMLRKVKGAGYSTTNLSVAAGIEDLAKDLRLYIAAVKEERITKGLDQFTKTTVAKLISLIDFSELED